jgi:hypothetical protein
MPLQSFFFFTQKSSPNRESRHESWRRPHRAYHNRGPWRTLALRLLPLGATARGVRRRPVRRLPRRRHTRHAKPSRRVRGCAHAARAWHRTLEGGHALAKWQKALRYLDVHPVLPDDASPELAEEFNTLRTPLLLNSALAAFKEPVGTAGARIAFSATSTVLGLLKLSDSDCGMYCFFFFLKVHVLKMLTVTCVSHFAAKALYRQGLPQLTLKEGEAAEGAFLEAFSLAKEDKAIAAELEHLRQRKKSQREKEKAAYKNFFG